MKKILSILAVALLALSPFAASAQTYTAQAGVSLFTGAPATATLTSGSVRLPNFSGSGTLSISEAGVTGSPSGCTVTLAYQANNSATPGAVVSTTSFTPASGTQTFNIQPSGNLTGDGYVAVFACSTYPTAGTLSASFSPVAVSSNDPCTSGLKSSVSIAVSSATTTSLVAVAAGKSVYVCGLAVAAVGTSPAVQLEYGTSTACTGTHALTGAMVPSATVGTVNLGFANGTVASAPASNGVCLVTSGTVTGANGVLTYVQQ